MAAPDNDHAPSVSLSRPKRISSLDWMRGIVMVLMVIDHASMAFNGERLSCDSACLYKAGTAMPAAEFLTRWISHLCAPTFVFLAGAALAISVERRVARGEDPRITDRQIITRGLLIAILDPTLISLASWRLTFQVLYAIGMSMVAMAFLRRLPTFWLLTAGLGWMIVGEWATAQTWDPQQGWPDIPSAFIVAAWFGKGFRVSYSLVPWLSVMVVGWVFGRYLNNYLGGKPCRLTPVKTLLLWGAIGLASFAAVRWFNDYGNMFLHRQNDSWIQWLFVSKYPPSLAFLGLELGLLFWCMAGLMVIERNTTSRPNGILLVFGQTAMFFYLVHRVVLETAAEWLGYRGQGDLTTTYISSAILLVLLYPMCLWYRGVKQKHPTSVLRYF